MPPFLCERAFVLFFMVGRGVLVKWRGGELTFGVIADSVRSRGGGVDIVLATTSFVVTTAVLATISLSVYSVLGKDVLPFRFFF